jgi:putative hemolysin
MVCCCGIMTHAAALDAAAVRLKHVVDELIEERCPRLAASPLWPLARPALYAALNYRAARRMADSIAALSGQAALDHVSALLALRLAATGAERIPRAGRCVIVANHPTGIADGVALYDFLKPIRPDVVFFANADALRVCPRLSETLIPVEWVHDKRTVEKTKQTLRAAHEAFAAERALMIFPAGRLARKIGGVIQDPDWEPSAVGLARRHRAPLVPIHIAGPYPFWFHTFNSFSKELRDITLFHELLNKAGRTFRLTVGDAIPPERLVGDSAVLSAALKSHTEERVGRGRPEAFAPNPEDRQA